MEKKNFVIEFLKDLVVSVIIVFFLIKFVMIPCQVDGRSMYPTLKPDEFGFSFIVTRKLGVKRFDIAVIKLEDKLLVKRVIAMPNETVEYKDSKLYIDGQYIEEDFLDGVKTPDFKYTLGEDEYYCLGDNREVSLDSRVYGPFTSSQLISTHLFVVKPLSEFGVKS